MIRQFSISTFLKQNHLLYLLLAGIIGLLYANTLESTFAVVDDLQGIVENPLTKDLGGSLKSFRLQHMLYALSYSLFGMNPFPIRIFSLLAHFVASALLSLVLYALYGRKVSWIGAILFAVHPVTAESINWISAQLYIIHTICAYSAILLYLAYRMSKRISYIFWSAVVIIAELILLRHPWVLVVPLIISVLELFWRKEPLRWKPLLTFWGVLLPAFLIFLLISFAPDVGDRLAYRQEGSNRSLVNQQSLTPILESYPYTIGSMIRLFVFPQTLTIYYDGNTLTNLSYLFLYGVTLMYGVALFYFFNKDRRIFTSLLLLLVALAPSLSPVKVTWYITERYLYLGTGLFVGLLAYVFISIEDKTRIKNLAVYLTILIGILFSIRTFQRNRDWKNPETLALATIRTSPLSVRPYNDLAGHYLIQGRTADAKTYYKKALEISPSGTAMHNLGYIYIKSGMDPALHTTTTSFDGLYTLGIAALEQKDLRAAMFYFNEALSVDPESSNLHSHIGYILTEYEMYDRATLHLEQARELDPRNAQTHYFIGYLAYKTGDVEKAKHYLKQTLELKPDHAEAQANLEYLQKQPQE